MEENELKLNAISGGLVEVKEEPEEDPEERQRKPTVLYKKQIKNAFPTGARLGKGVYATLNNEFSDQLEVVLKLAYKQAQDRNKKTISGTDIKNAFIEYKKQNATYILDDFQTVFDGKIKEMKQNIKGSE